jgi:zinc transport system substrate-binding protein
MSLALMFLDLITPGLPSLNLEPRKMMFPTPMHRHSLHLPLQRAIGRLFVWLLLLSTWGHVSADPPRVVASIPPLHSLASAVMQDVAPVALLLPAGHSPHDGGLAPSVVRGLSSADLLLWSGPTLETGLARAVTQLPAGRVITLTESSQLRLLPQRAAGLSGGHQHAHGHDGHDTQPGGAVDPHLWLSSHNAGAIVELLAARLIQLDPNNESRYRANAEKTLQRIGDTHRGMEQSLAPVRDIPYLVFHDAYQYFEVEYGLRASGSVTLNPGRTPGARRLEGLRALARDQGIRCLFAEPQFEPRAVAVVVEDSGVQTGVLDPLGTRQEPGPSLWFEVMQGLAAALLECLGREDG